MILRRTVAALLAPFAFSSGEEAQAQSSSDSDTKPALEMRLNAVPDGRFDADAAVRSARQEGFAGRGDGLLRSWDLEGNAVLGIGRFTVPDLPRPRTYMEDDEHPTSVRQRDGGIAAIGVKMPF